MSDPTPLTDQPGTDPIGETTPETARALLWRHGLPEDVIDGALALFAQELAATQRKAHDERRPYFHMGLPCSPGFGCHVGELIELITPARGDASPAVPVSSPPPDQTADRAAFLREAADGFDRHAEQILDGVGDKAVFVAKALRDQAAVWREAAETLRRMAAEAQQPNTETQAHPPIHAWRVETRDPGTNQWMEGSHFAHRPNAVERWETANRTAPLWNNGTPVERRIVRETTTYTVDQPDTAPEPGRV